jgi:hypothetical protein
MSMSVTTQWSAAFVRRLVRGWRSWIFHNAAPHGERSAHAVGHTGAGLRTLAGKWPDAAELLSRRLAGDVPTARKRT